MDNEKPKDVLKTDPSQRVWVLALKFDVCKNTPLAHLSQIRRANKWNKTVSVRIKSRDVETLPLNLAPNDDL